MSPLLYAIQASLLSFQLDSFQQIHSLSGLRMSSNVKDINHTQFADDTLLQGGTSVISARHFKQELDRYKEVSCSKIKFQKSKIYSWNYSPREMFEIAIVLEMEGTMIWESFKYLGIPIFKVSPRVAHWLPLLDKLKLCIRAWGETWLNLARKVVLLKLVLTSLPIYQNSILLAPKTMTLKIDGLLRIFL